MDGGTCSGDPGSCCVRECDTTHQNVLFNVRRRHFHILLYFIDVQGSSRDADPSILCLMYLYREYERVLHEVSFYRVPLGYFAKYPYIGYLVVTMGYFVKYPSKRVLYEVPLCRVFWGSLHMTGGRRSPAVACWASDHWVASSNPLRGKFRH